MATLNERTLQQRQILFLVLVGILVACVLCICTALILIHPPREEKDEYAGPKNILFIVVDDLRPALGCYGDPTAITPNIDALASKSILFKNAYAQQALCAPSRTSFLTSRRPDSLCLFDNGKYWRSSVGNFTTLPQHFKDYGYETVSVGKIFHHGLVSNKSDDYPYSWSKYPFRPQSEECKMKPVCPTPKGNRTNLMCPVDVSSQPFGTLPDIESTDYAIDYLMNKSLLADRDVPFFLGVGYYKPHIPFKFPTEFLDLYPIESMELVPNPDIPANLNNISWNPWKDLRDRDDVEALNVPYPFGPLPTDYQKVARQGYYASVSYMDDQLGRLLEALEKSGFASHTAIVLLGDHGWSLGEHQEWSKYSNFDVSVRVPLIIYDPGLTEKGPRTPFVRTPVLDLIPKKPTPGPEGVPVQSQNASTAPSTPAYISEELVELVDLFPTIAEIANISIPLLCRLYSTNFCSEGLSFYKVIKYHINESHAVTTHCADVSIGEFSWKTAAFSQYPRPSKEIQRNSDQPKHKDIRYMGYTMTTNRFRYTEWVAFNVTVCKANWSDSVAAELYDHKYDSLEMKNQASDPFYDNTVKDMSKKLRLGWRHALPACIFGN